MTTLKTAPFLIWSLSILICLSFTDSALSDWNRTPLPDTFLLPGGRFLMVIILVRVRGGRQSIPVYVGLRCCVSTSLPSKLQLSFHQQQWWECRVWEPRTFLKSFLSVVNYWKQLQVSDCFLPGDNWKCHWEAFFILFSWSLKVTGSHKEESRKCWESCQDSVSAICPGFFSTAVIYQTYVYVCLTTVEHQTKT